MYLLLGGCLGKIAKIEIAAIIDRLFWSQVAYLYEIISPFLVSDRAGLIHKAFVVGGYLQSIQYSIDTAFSEHKNRRSDSGSFRMHSKGASTGLKFMWNKEPTPVTPFPSKNGENGKNPDHSFSHYTCANGVIGDNSGLWQSVERPIYVQNEPEKTVP